MELENLHIGSLRYTETYFDNYVAVVSVCDYLPKWCAKCRQIRDNIVIEDHVDKNVHHLAIDIIDEPREPIFKHFETVNKFIDKYIDEGRVLVHCLAGISRSSSFYLAYYMYKTKTEFEESYRKMKTRYIQCNPNGGFLNQLITYSKYNFSIPDEQQFMLDVRCFSQLNSYNCKFTDNRKAIFLCKKCRTDLFTSDDVLFHTSPGIAFCRSIFVKPMAWMQQLDEESGKILCKNTECSAKLGSFVWHGNVCNCGFRQVPSFQIHYSKIDRKIMNEAEEKSRELPKTLFD